MADGNRIFSEEDLLGNRTVFIEGEITVESAAVVRDSLFRLQQKSSEEIFLIINSKGGLTHAGLGLFDSMKNFIHAPVTGVALERCGSAATFILLGCQKRIATQHALLLIHSTYDDPKIEFNVRGGIMKRIYGDYNSLLKTDEGIIQLYINNLKPIPWKNWAVSNLEKRKFVIELLNRGDEESDYLLNTDESIHFGLIDEVVTGKLPCFLPPRDSKR